MSANMRAYGSLPKLISLTVSTITVLIKVSDAGISFSHYQSAQVWCYRKLCSFVSPGFNSVLHVLSIFYLFFLGAAGNSANKLLLLVCHRLSAAMLILLFAVNLLMLINVINVNLFADVCPFLEKHEMQMSLFSFHLLCRLLGNCFHFVRIRTHICTNKKIHKDKIY